MCQSLPDDIPGKQKVRGIGFCSPTYFVFQMRVDNHLSPWDAKALDEEDRSIDEAPMYRSVDVDEATLEEEGVEGEE
jgi:hypothetical protein